MFKLRIWFLIACLTVRIGRGEIIEITAIDSTKDHTTHENILLIFDLDNVVMHPEGGVGSPGSDEWWTRLVEIEKTAGADHSEAIKKALPLLHKAYMETDVKPVEPQVVTLIHSFQEKKITVMALTARSPQFSHRTIEQLASIGIDFSKTALIKEQHEKWLPEGACYQHGILFCGIHDKGLALAALLAATGFNPTKIVCIDDKLKNLTAVELVLQKHTIPFLGLRYGYLDEAIHLFYTAQPTTSLSTGETPAL